MSINIGPPYWQYGYDNGAGASQQVGSFFDSMADVIGAPMQLAPAQQYYRPMPQQAMFQRPIGPGIPSQRIIPTIPGAPAIGVKLQPLGFTVVSFTATSGLSLTATTRPQKPFKGRRLVVDIARTGTTATGLVTINSLNVGVNNQWVSSNPVGAGSFAATAFDVNVELSACSSALDITVNYSITAAPTMTDRVDIATTLFGETVGS